MKSDNIKTNVYLYSLPCSEKWSTCSFVIIANVRGSVFAYANVGLPLRNISILSTTTSLLLLLDDDDDIDLTVDDCAAKPVAVIDGWNVDFIVLTLPPPPERR